MLQRPQWRKGCNEPSTPSTPTQEEPPDIPAWNIGRATQRLSDDESFGNTSGTLTGHPMNISPVYRECSLHGHPRNIRSMTRGCII